jgi:hypothetical protein
MANPIHPGMFRSRQRPAIGGSRRRLRDDAGSAPPDCPYLETLLDRLGEVTQQPVMTHQIASEEEAAARGMAGSPTLLVDGIDPSPMPTSGQRGCGVASTATGTAR